MLTVDLDFGGWPISRALARRGVHTSHAILPIPRPSAAMSDCQNYDFRRKVLIYKAKRKLPEGIFSEISDVDWPALRSFPDSSYRLLKGAFKVNRRNQAALSIPSQRCQILLLRLGMKSKRLTCHAAVYVPSAGPLPKR